MYAIDVSDYDGQWRNQRLAQTRQTLEEREPSELARAILEDWIVDHPAHLAGGERVQVFAETAIDYPPDKYTHVRVWIYRGGIDDHEPVPCSAAYLVDMPNE